MATRAAREAGGERQDVHAHASEEDDATGVTVVEPGPRRHAAPVAVQFCGQGGGSEAAPHQSGDSAGSGIIFRGC